MFFLLFIVLPALEIYSLFKVGSVLGVVNTLALLLISMFIGSIMIRHLGRQIFLSVQMEVAQGRVPADKVLRGFLFFLAGVLFVIPGFITDLLAVALIFPLTRWLLLRLIKNYFQSQIRQGRVHVYSNYSTPPWADDSASDMRDVSPPMIDVTPTNKKNNFE